MFNSYEYQQPPTAFDESLDTFLDRLDGQGSVKTPQAIELEAYGWRTWLRTIAPNNFKSPFSHEQEKYWILFWRIMKKLRHGMPLTNREMTIIKPFPRGYGKSTGGEVSCVMEGAVVGFGYDLYLCDTKSLAEGHLSSIVEVCQNGQVEQFYPDLARPKLKESGKGEYSQSQIVCEHWAVAARGISQNVRGKRVNGLRYTLIVADEIDNLDDSLPVVLKKERRLARSVVPAGAKNMVFVFAQNLIHENAIATRIVEKKTDVLRDNTIIGGGAVKAFKEIEFKKHVNEQTGEEWHTIEHCVSTWEYFDIEDAKRFLGRAGLDAFKAEYQHEFTSKKGRMIPEMDKKRHVITWSQFEKVFGVRYIPEHWQIKTGADIGYTDKSKAAWAFNATAAFNSPLPGKKFMYRGMVFTDKSIDWQMLQVWKSFFPKPDIGKMHFEAVINFGIYPDLYRSLYLDPACRKYLEGNYIYDEAEMLYRHKRYNFDYHWQSNIMSMQISHEKSGELKTSHEKYGMPLTKMEDFTASSGTSQWNNMLKGDYQTPHPFRDDEIVDEDLGLYKYGCPDLFYIIEDHETDYKTGVMQFVNDAIDWKWMPQAITEAGITDAKPMKMFDTVDAERCIYTTFGAKATARSTKEKVEMAIQKNISRLTEANIEKMPVDQKGFAIAERNEIVEKLTSTVNNGNVIKPKGTDWTDF